jgi:hypothetical protein
MEKRLFRLSQKDFAGFFFNWLNRTALQVPLQRKMKQPQEHG